MPSLTNLLTVYGNINSITTLYGNLFREYGDFKYMRYSQF